MPELPEVEITRQGIVPHVCGRKVDQVIVREARLRYPVPPDLAKRAEGSIVAKVERRAKYLVLVLDGGGILIHLGMSGSLRIVPRSTPAVRHDHVDFVFGSEILRLRDPRRFGAILWLDYPLEAHPLLRSLGVEPLADSFSGTCLRRLFSGTKRPVKLALMDGHLVVGVGNIYASESLFRARIHPAVAASSLGLERCEELVTCIKATLADALAAGGSSLRDFVHSDGSSGYFQQQYYVYGREGKPCRQCGDTVQRIVLGQRASFYCPSCQGF